MTFKFLKYYSQVGVIPAQNRAAKAEQNKPGPTISAKAENVRNTGIANSVTKKCIMNISLLRVRHWQCDDVQIPKILFPSGRHPGAEQSCKSRAE